MAEIDKISQKPNKSKIIKVQSETIRLYFMADIAAKYTLCYNQAMDKSTQRPEIRLSPTLYGDLSPPKNRLWRFFKLRSNQGFSVHVVTRGIGDNMYRKTHLAIKKMKVF